MPHIEMTREQLYELVWSKPMVQVAAGLPMSQASLRKLCLKHQVPLPPQGYWKKQPAARTSSRIPLPPLEMGDQRIWKRRFLQRKAAPVPLTGSLLLPDPTRWHECTKRTKSALARATPDLRGALKAEGQGVACLNVAPETVPRALAVLDALIRAVERLGYSISMKTSPAKLFVNGTLVPVTIVERFARSDEPADAKEFQRRQLYERRYPKYFRLKDIEAGWTHRPSGQLTVMLSDGYLHGVLCRWADGVSHSVESRLNEVAEAAIVHAQTINEIRERIQRRTAARGESEEQRQRVEPEEDQEGKRVAFFRHRAAEWAEAERLERLVQHVRRTDDYQTARMFEFLKWSDAYVAGLREKCSALTIDSDLADNGLWGA